MYIIAFQVVLIVFGLAILAVAQFGNEFVSIAVFKSLKLHWNVESQFL